jgi:hypothetical protein
MSATTPKRGRPKQPVPITIQGDQGKIVSLTLELGTAENPVSFTLSAPAEEFSERLNALEIILPSLIEQIVTPSELPTGQETVKFVASNYQAQPSDSVIVVDTSNGDVTISLPSATNMGKRLVITKETSDASTVSIAPFGNDTIESSSTKTLSTLWAKAVLECDGVSNWLDLITGGV